MRWRHLLWAVLCAVITVPMPPVLAGGRSENLLLVVNANSEDSLAIANHYIRLRDIPACNVLYLDYTSSVREVKAERFRKEILQPIINTIEQRKLGAQIAYVVYSADFPYRINFEDEFKEEKLAKQFRPRASITGATYLWTYTLTKNPALVMPTVNWYAPPVAQANQTVCRDCSEIPTRAFRAARYWTKQGEATNERKQGQTYFISTMLGVTVERGNTVEEITRYLTRSSVADAAQPQGTFYFMRNDDVRSKARHDCFDRVARKLRGEGAQVEVLEGIVPPSAENALGVMTGCTSFRLDGGAVSLAPGAIADHFTSYGGRFDAMSQSKLSVWMRAGAAGSSGTVFEPYALQAKFPQPCVHLHYRRGATLGEAFYQSVTGPYQLLVVGDPLCQPWAKQPKVEITGLEQGQTVSGQVLVKAKVSAQPGTQPKLCELYLDGRLLARYPYALPVPLEAAKLSPGEHELRLVATTADPLEYRGRQILSFRVPAEPAKAAGDGPASKAAADLDILPDLVSLKVEKHMVDAGQPLRVQVTGPSNSTGIEILQNSRRVGYVQGGSGELQLDTTHLGRGPVRLVAQTADHDQQSIEPPSQPIRSKAFWVLIR